MNSLQLSRPLRSGCSKESKTQVPSLRFASSSMKTSSSSKSMPSPGRPRVAGPQISLSSTLSGRLRTNGSMKGGLASPMFPPAGKKRGCVFENPEPSSPKVTCIGHVRVKTKKQGKKPPANHHYHHSGEVSFRRVEVATSGLQRSGRQDLNLMSSQKQMRDTDGEGGAAGRNHRQGHLPEAVCGKFRMFGAEWNCFQPCRSSCSMKGEEKGRAGGESKEESYGGGSCGAVIARWLVSLNEGPEGKGGERKIELVVGEEEHVDERSERYRRQVFEGIEFDERGITGFEGKEGEEERGRVSVCIPPKNALLLMRCRSDPVKVAALVSKFCDGPVQRDDVDDGREVLGHVCGIRDLDAIRRCLREGVCEATQGEEQCATMDEDEEEEAEVNLLANELSELISSSIKEEFATDEPLKEAGVCSFEHSDQEKLDLVRRDDPDHGAKEHDEVNCVLSVHFLSESEESKERRELTEAEAEVLRSSKDTVGSENEESQEYLDRQEKLESGVKGEAPKLPDCLLLMMREPKLSMEVSRETWVCSNDFLRWLPERPVASRIPSKIDAGDDSKKKTNPIHSSATSAATRIPSTALTAQQERILQQPPRDSCSFPGKRSDHGMAELTAALIEQKLVSANAQAHEALILTRCKSAPMRADAKLHPDACFWKNRRLEPHRRPVNNLVKAAGIRNVS